VPPTGGFATVGAWGGVREGGKAAPTIPERLVGGTPGHTR